MASTGGDKWDLNRNPGGAANKESASGAKWFVLLPPLSVPGPMGTLIGPAG